VGDKPKTRREALLIAIARKGYCDTDLVDADLTESMDANEITWLILAGEFGRDRLELTPKECFDEIHREVVAWIFGAKGARSGLTF
jgi:hypothetical protein